MGLRLTEHLSLVAEPHEALDEREQERLGRAAEAMAALARNVRHARAEAARKYGRSPEGFAEQLDVIKNAAEVEFRAILKRAVFDEDEAKLEWRNEHLSHITNVMGKAPDGADELRTQPLLLDHFRGLSEAEQRAAFRRMVNGGELGAIRSLLDVPSPLSVVSDELAREAVELVFEKTRLDSRERALFAHRLNTLSAARALQDVLDDPAFLSDITVQAIPEHLRPPSLELLDSEPDPEPAEDTEPEPLPAA